MGIEQLLEKAIPLIGGGTAGGLLMAALWFFKQWRESNLVQQKQEDDHEINQAKQSQTNVEFAAAQLQNQIAILLSQIKEAYAARDAAIAERDKVKNDCFEEKSRHLQEKMNVSFDLKQEQTKVALLGSQYELCKEEIEKRDAHIAHLSEVSIMMADNIPAIVWMARPDGELDFYNQAWYKYTGQTVAEAFGWGWEPVIHHDDLAKCVETWKRCIVTGEDYNIEYRFRRKDGVYRWHIGRATALRNDGGEVVRWFGICVDVDDVKPGT